MTRWRRATSTSPSSSSRPNYDVANTTVSSTELEVESQLHDSYSTRRSNTDTIFDILFHLPDIVELQQLRLYKSSTLLTLQAMIQREFHIPFEDQRIYYQGDLLEGNEELCYYEIHDHCVIDIRVIRRYRSLGDVFTKIKMIQLSKTRHDDYELIEGMARLPPSKIVFKRLLLILSFIIRVDTQQSRRTGRRVWKTLTTRIDSASGIEDAIAKGFNTQRRRSSMVSEFWKSEEPDKEQVELTPLQSVTTNMSFIVCHTQPKLDSYVMSLAQEHEISQRLQISIDQRTPHDIRHIKKWLGKIKYFSNAGLPDKLIHEIARTTLYTRHRAGDFLFRQGDIGDNFYIVITGSLSLAAYGNGFFANMTPGMCFGELSLFAGACFRTASAIVNFITPYAEMAMLSGDIYRRIINPYKQTILQSTERAIRSIPAIQLLPDRIITLIAYASKPLTAPTGTKLIKTGDHVDALVLLVKGEVKVATSGHKMSQGQPTNTQDYSIVSVVRAPAVFGQEGCLTLKSSSAPWDIVAVATCTLVCLRSDTISSFLSPRQDVIETLNYEHQQREAGFRARFVSVAQEWDNQQLDKHTTAYNTKSLSKRLLKKQLATASKLAESAELRANGASMSFGNESSNGKIPSVASRIPFPKVLEDEKGREDDGSEKDNLSNEPHVKLSSLRSPRTVDKPKFSHVQDLYLHHTLPYNEVLPLRDQIQFVSFSMQQRQYEHDRRKKKHPIKQLQKNVLRGDGLQTVVKVQQSGKTAALLDGLRQLEPEEVEMIVETPISANTSHLTQYHFAPRRPTSLSLPAVASPRASISTTLVQK